jgi:hypothetical protein
MVRRCSLLRRFSSGGQIGKMAARETSDQPPLMPKNISVFRVYSSA